MSSSGSDQSYRGLWCLSCISVQTGEDSCLLLKLAILIHSAIRELYELVNCGRCVASAARPRHGCSWWLLNGPEQVLCFFSVLGLDFIIALMITFEFSNGISSVLVSIMQVGLNPCLWEHWRVQGDVLVLTCQVLQFFIRCLFHMGRLVNLFHMPGMLEQWALWQWKTPGGTLQGGLVSFFWP